MPCLATCRRRCSSRSQMSWPRPGRARRRGQGSPPPDRNPKPAMRLREFQEIIQAIYGERDRSRGRDGTFRWLAEEVGELARAVRTGDAHSLHEEFSDVLAG